MVLPVFYFVCIAFNVFAIMYDGSESMLCVYRSNCASRLTFTVLGFDKLSLWAILAISVGAGLLVGVVVKVFGLPRLKKWILCKSNSIVNVRRYDCSKIFER
jgi:hypothetical protein